jgi:hypothetical protein
MSSRYAGSLDVIWDFEPTYRKYHYVIRRGFYE